MRKLISVLLAVFMALLLCTACACDKLEYNGNLGYDFNNVKNKEITFNAYHSNTKDGSWEQITSFTCTPRPGHYNDVTLECKGDKILLELRDNTYTESEDAATYDGTVEDSYEFKVDGLKRDVVGWASYDIRDIEGEQLVRLYPISNRGDVATLADISLDKPYDKDGVLGNLDNILITVVMK